MFIGLGFRPGGLDGDPAEQVGVHAADQVIRIDLLLLVELPIADPDAASVVLDAGDGGVEVNTLSQPVRERVRQFLVPALEPVDHRRSQRHASSLQNSGMPNHVQGRALVPDELDGRSRGAVLLQNVVERNAVQAVQTRVEGLVFVGETVEIGIQIKRGEVPPGMFLEVFDLFLIESEAGENLRVSEIGVREALSIDEVNHVLAVRVIEGREVELPYVAPIEVVSGLGEMLRAHVRIKPIGEGIVDRSHMAAGAPGGLEEHYIVAAHHQFVGAAQPSDTATRHHHSVRISRFGSLPPKRRLLVAVESPERRNYSRRQSACRCLENVTPLDACHKPTSPKWHSLTLEVPGETSRTVAAPPPNLQTGDSPLHRPETAMETSRQHLTREIAGPVVRTPPLQPLFKSQRSRRQD